MTDEAVRRDGGPRHESGLQTDAQRFLSFSLCGEEYAIPLLKVREVIAFSDVTPVPHTPPHFRGIMNLRGQIISVVDLRIKLRMSKSDVTSETAVVILDVGSGALGVVVDSVNSVLAVAPEAINPPPDIGTSIDTTYLTGVARRDKRLVLLIDIERTLSVEDLQAIKNQRKNGSAAA